MSEPPPPQPQPVARELTGRIGKYDIVKLLGKGAMGQVYLAKDTMLDREVALKVMVASIADDPELKARFEREAKAVAKMSHPNVVNVFDLGYHSDGSPYMAMELLRGTDLQKAVRQTPPLSLERKVNILIQVLAGLAHAHQAGIIHRDIKPANVFLNQDGSVKIMDFGVARLTTASMTGTGAIVGTADYMSPEQVRGAKVDGRSDLFSVGCMFFELVTGRRPFRAENLMAVFYKITHEEPNWNLVPEGEAYDALLPTLKKSLAKDLQDRYANAYEFATDLRAYLSGRATSTSAAAHALEGLEDIDAPPTAGPQAVTDLFDVGPTVVEGEPRTGPRTSSTASAAATQRGTTTPTVRPAPTRVQVAPTVLEPRPGRPHPPAARPGRAAPAPASRTNPALYAALALGAVAVAGVGYLLWHQTQPRPTPEPLPTTLAAAPATTLQPVPTTLALSPPTTAPPPTFAETVGKAARSMRAAQAAFRQGDYDKAVSQAQAALRDDPGNGDAQKLLGNALDGQKASARFRAAEQALAGGNLAQAQSEAEAGQQLAAWDARGPSLISRIRQAQQQAEQAAAARKQQQAQAELNGLLAQADQALSSQKYDQAIALYDQALAKDPANQRAALGRTSAVSAKAVAEAAERAGSATGPAPPVGKHFATGRTEAKSGGPKGGSVPAGFEDTPGVVAKSATAAAELPGKLSFDIAPEKVKAGDRYTVKVSLHNEGTAPIQISSMIVTTVVNGRRIQAPVPPLAKEVAPAQTALILSPSDVWRDDTTSWSMEVLVQTVRGDTYKNKVEWK
jgi:eukaryotic-like serine/threonine-protein kinase